MKSFEINPLPAIQLGRNLGTKKTDALVLNDLSYVHSSTNEWLIDADVLEKLDDQTRRLQGLALFSQMMELYVYPDLPKPLEVLIWSAIESFTQSFLPALEFENGAIENLGYGAVITHLMSEQVGYGLSHHISDVISENTSDDKTEIQSGMIAEITELQIRLLSERLPDGASLEKYVMIGEALAMRPYETAEEACASLIGTLRRWVSKFEINKVSCSRNILDTVLEQVRHKDILFWQQMHINPSELEVALSRRMNLD